MPEHCQLLCCPSAIPHAAGQCPPHGHEVPDPVAQAEGVVSLGLRLADDEPNGA